MATVEVTGSVPSAAAISAVQATSQAAYAAQATWFIDPVNGNDSATGLTSGTAIKTEGQRRQRIGSAPILVSTTVTLLGTAAAGDFFNPPLVGPGGYIYYTGTLGATVLFTGVLTAAAAQSGNNPATVTDSSIPVSWTASGLVGKRLRVTSGARAGAVQFIAADLGSKRAMIGDAQIPPKGAFQGFATTRVTLQVGDPYVIEQLPMWPIAFQSGIAAEVNGGFYAKIGWEGLNFSKPDGSGSWAVVPNYGTGEVHNFMGCNMSAMAGTFSAYASLWDHGFLPDAGHQPLLDGCVILSSGSTVCYADPGSDVVLTDGTIFVGASNSGTAFDVLGTVNVYGAAGAGFINSSGDGVRVAPGGFLVAGSTFYGGSTPLWGSGNAHYGARVDPAGTVFYSTTPTLTGTSGDAIIGGTAKTWSVIAAAGYSGNGGSAWVTK